MLRFLFRFFHQSPLRWNAALAALFSLGLALELFALHAFDATESRLTDLFNVQHAAEYTADPDIIVIDVDDRSLVAMEEAAGLWPWPREVHADLLEALAEFAPRAIVFDIAFPKDMRRPKSDARFSSAIGAMPNVYLAATLLDHASPSSGASLRELSTAFGIRQTGLRDAHAALDLPDAVAHDAWRLGLINRADDNDGVLRRYRLYSEVQGWRLPSVPARVAADLGNGLPPGKDFLMRWPAKHHRHISYGELYRLLTEKRPMWNDADMRQWHAAFHSRIFVIGVSAASAFDIHRTPLASATPGVDALAIALDNLKNGHAVEPLPRSVPLAFGVALMALLALAFSRRVNPLLIAVLLAIVSSLALAADDAALGHDILLPLATPLIFAWSLYLCAALEGFVRERRTRRQAVALFGRFLNPNVVKQIVEQGQTVESLSGRTSNISVLFSDIRGFTTLSETRSPHEIVDILNRHFDRQVEIVFRHGGTLDKFIGDCIMAFWGAPLDDPDHARHAVAAALEMQEALLAFKQELAEEGSNVADFDVGIGVHSGPAVVGFIGARRKLDYTAIGDTVNLASRVEGLTKGVARVLVTKETRLACSASDDFIFELRGEFAVKGRAAAVELHEPRRRT